MPNERDRDVVDLREWKQNELLGIGEEVIEGDITNDEWGRNHVKHLEQNSPVYEHIRTIPAFDYDGKVIPERLTLVGHIRPPKGETEEQ